MPVKIIMDAHHIKSSGFQQYSNNIGKLTISTELVEIMLIIQVLLLFAPAIKNKILIARYF